MDEPEIPLTGGDVTDGLVRVGGTVRRPPSPESSAVAMLLRELEARGFPRAPRHLGVDDRGRHILTFVEGEVAGRPWPAWVAHDERATSVARLVRAYDDVAMSIGLPDWAAELIRPDPEGAPASIAGPPRFVAHLDITPENTVFRDGGAAALIDFDLARPATRAEEVANLLLWWGAWMPVPDREPAMQHLDAPVRGGMLVDAYGLEPADRAALVAVTHNQAERTWYRMRERSRTLGGGWRRMWDAGVGDRIRRRIAWLERHAAELEAAVSSSGPAAPSG